MLMAIDRRVMPAILPLNLACRTTMPTQALWPAVEALQRRMPYDASIVLRYLQIVYDSVRAEKVRSRPVLQRVARCALCR